MNNRVILSLIMFLLLSCKMKNEENAPKRSPQKVATDNQNIPFVKKTNNANTNLIRIEEIQPGSEMEYRNFKTKLSHPEKIDIKFVDDKIIATTYIMANECLGTFEDIEYKNDSIFLISKHKPIEDDACSGVVIKKLVYTIKNTERKRYKFNYKGINLY